MHKLNTTPVPLFFLVDEYIDNPDAPGLPETLNVAGYHLVPVTGLRTPMDQLSGDATRAYLLHDRFNDDVLETESGQLLWEYSEWQLEVLVNIATRLNIRAYDVAAYIAHRVFPHLGVLDSVGRRIKSLYTLPPNALSIHQEHTYLEQNVPLSITPGGAQRRAHQFETGPKESGRHTIPAPDPIFGIKVEYTSNPEGADVVIGSLPAGFPPTMRALFEPLMRQHVPYTEEDRESDIFYGGSPVKEEHASDFAKDVNYAVAIAKNALLNGLFAHSEGLDWAPHFEPYSKDDGTEVRF